MGSGSDSEYHVSLDDLDANARQATTIDDLLEKSAGQALFTRDDVAHLLHELRQAQHALQASADGLSLALDSATAALWSWEPATNRFQWTPHLARNWGLEPASLRTLADWRDRVHSDDFARALAEHDAAIAEKRAFAIEFRLLLPGGEARWVASHGRGVYDDAGTLTRVAGVVTDITAHKAAEAAQQASDARLRAQWESSPVASFIWKMLDRQFVLVEVNPAAEKMSWGKAHEFVGRTAEEIYPDRPDMLGCFRACLEQQSVIRHTTDYQARGTGRRRVMDFTFAFVPPDGILLHAEDLTEVRRSEADLRFTQAVVDRMSDATYWAMEDGHLVYVNEASCAQLGYARAELLGLPITAIVAGASPAQWQARWRALKQQGALRFETGHVRKDGTVIPVDVQVSLIQAGAKEYACGIARDISERKAMEAALRAGEAKFSTLFALSPVALAITRVEDGAFVEVNSVFAAMTGYSRDDLLGHTALERHLYANPADRATIVAEIVRNGQVTGYPAQMRTKDGVLIDCLLSMKCVVIDGVSCYLAGFIDMSPLRQVEAALRASEAKFASFFELSPVSLTITRVDDGRFVAVNSVFEQTSGYMRADVLGRTALELNLYANPADRDAVIAAIRRNGRVRGRPVTIHRKDGSLSECLMSVTIVPVNGVDCFLSGIVDTGPLRQAEAALRTQQADMLALLENTDSSIWSIDTSYRLTACNSVFRRNVRRSVGHEPAVGESVLADAPAVAADEWRAYYDRALGGERFTIDVQRRFVDPSRWMEYRFSPVRSNEGEIIGVTVLGRDITEQRRAARQIEEQLAEISLYYDTTPTGLAVLDRDLRFLRVNRLLAEMNGIPAADHIGKTVDEIVPSLALQARQVTAAILATGEPITNIEFSGETAADPGVTHHWVEGWYPVRQEDDEIVGFSVIVEDITEKKRMQAQLERQQQNLARAQEIGQLGSWEWDIPNQRLEWSDELYRIFGVGHDFALSYETIDAMLHPDDRAGNDAKVQAALAAGETTEYEFRIVRPDGTIRNISQSIEISRDAAGAPVTLFGVMQDITEQKRAAAEHEQLQAQLAQARKMETVGRLAGGIAHDFNNMLAVILLRTEMALQTVAAGTPLHRSLSTILTTGQRSATLVQQLLGFARKQTIAPKVVDLNEAVPGMLPMLEKLIGEEVDLRWQPGADLWMVKMDPSQLDQILTNLCVNARDAIDGVGTIVIATANATLPRAPAVDGSATANDAYVLLSVTDTGSGMAPELLEHIFEPFYTTKGVGKGTGLGLATVEGIVEQNKGHIQVASTPSLGTTFAIYLPRFAEPVEASPAPATSALVRGEGRTVLLVEDEAVVLEMATEVLRSLGYGVIAAATPGAALRVLEDDTVAIDVLITDVIMPEMNGVLLAERVRQRRPAIKTLFVSGYPADYMADRGLLAKDANFLAKPFSMQRLASMVAEVLGEAR